LITPPNRPSYAPQETLGRGDDCGDIEKMAPLLQIGQNPGYGTLRGQPLREGPTISL